MAAVKMTRKYAFFPPKNINIQFPLIIVIVNQVIRNDHYRNTVFGVYSRILLFSETIKSIFLC